MICVKNFFGKCYNLFTGDVLFILEGNTGARIHETKIALYTRPILVSWIRALVMGGISLLVQWIIKYQEIETDHYIYKRYIVLSLWSTVLGKEKKKTRIGQLPRF